MIRFREEMIEAIDNGVNVQHRFPVFSKDVQADISFQVNIRMINLRLAFDLWSFMGVDWRNLEREDKCAT